MSRLRAASAGLLLAVLITIVCACGAEPTPPARPVAAWVPDDADVPASVANRTALPFCGIATPDVPPALIGCITRAQSSLAGGELVMDHVVGTSRSIQIIRVLAPGNVEILYGTHPSGLPWLWEIARCDRIEAGDGDRPGLVLGECEPLVELR